MISSSFVNYAHRGASSYAPENTFASFYKGIELGANGIETDVQATSDGVLVLHHDDTLLRICGIDKAVKDLTFTELRELDFGGFFGKRFCGEKIVTLTDFLTYFSSKPLTFAIEIKQDGIEFEVDDICRRFLEEKKYYITSFIPGAVLRLAESAKPPQLGFLSSASDGEDPEKYRRACVKQYCPFAPELNEAMMTRLRDLGFNIRAWGVADEEIMKKAYFLGVDGMTVNFPDKLKALIDSYSSASGSC